MDGIKKVAINGREYTVAMMSPTQLHGYYYDLQAAAGRGESIARFDRTAIGQCRDSMLRPLREDANFEACFSEHPEDMLLLGSVARNALILPFLPSNPDTGPTGTP